MNYIFNRKNFDTLKSKNIMKNIHKFDDNKIVNKWKMIITSSSSK